MKLLIAEDEQAVREGMVHSIDWSAYGIDICGEAGNGTDALTMMKEHKPELLLTDIRMPHMNGLELIEQAQGLGLSFRSIILSGYNEFDYAKQALRLGASDFVLKPCRPEEIIRTVLSAKKYVESQTAREIEIEERDRSWNRNVPLMKSQILTGWIHYPSLPLENRKHLLTELEMNFRDTNVQVGLIRVDTSQIGKDGRDLVLMRYAAMNIVRETLGPVFRNCIEVFQEGNDLIFIATVNGSSSELLLKEGELLKPHMKELQANLEKYVKMTVSIAIGSSQASINDINYSYGEAVQAMESRFYQGRGGVFFYEERLESNGGEVIPAKEALLDIEWFEEVEQHIFDDLRHGSYEKALDLVDSWLDMFKTKSYLSKQEVHLRATTFMVSLQRIAKEHRMVVFEWKNELVSSMEQLPQVETLEELTTIIKKIVQHFVEACSSNRTLHRTVQLVIDIIKERYNTNLTLELVAREAFVSNTYLSSLFKQELGINFLDYLHQYRIEKAKELLQQDLKIYAVARLVGYQEERHFSSTFKKWTGVTPSQYKANIN